MNIADFFTIKMICEKHDCCVDCPFIHNDTFTKIFCNLNLTPNEWNIKDVETMCNNFNEIVDEIVKTRIRRAKND